MRPETDAMEKNKETLNEYISASIREHWDLPSLTDMNGTTFLYRDVARKIAKLHLLFEHIGIERGDKIALCGRNSAGWCVAYLATVTYGAVIVPILNEFKADNIHHLVNHSDARLLFVDRNTWENLDPALMGHLKGSLLIADFSLLHSNSPELNDARAHLNEYFGQRFPDRFTRDDVQYAQVPLETLALISYTSGSTGFSKGVMLSHRVLWSNVQYCIDQLTLIEACDGIVSMLPLAHMYGMMVDFLYGISVGAHLHFLTRTPSPRVIIEAFAKVRPKMIVSVPLILEKIIKTRVFPLLDKPLMKILMHVPFVDERLLNKIKAQLQDTFGGRLKEIIIGGAGLNHDVEVFLRRIGFPYTAGYGMTECGPLISYAHAKDIRLQSCGRAVDRMQLRIASSDGGYMVPGVLWVRGDNVMDGYYKNPEATEAVLKDGWLNTGDICRIDPDGFLYIRGRDKNMILGPSGQNIYPEEIEQKLNNLPYVSESIIIEEKGQLTALVYPDIDNARAQGITMDTLIGMMDENLVQLNREIPAYCRVSRVRVYNEEFEKTPKKSIKRYLYQR